MANVRISELPAATLPLTGAELVPVVQSGVTKQTLAAAVGAGVVNVKAYGAKGDGVTDDTAAIQAAFSQTGRTVCIPAGTYVVSSTLTPTCAAIIGEGETTSVIRPTAAVTKAVSIGAVGYPFALSSFGVNGTNTTNATGIFFGDTGSCACSVDSISVFNFGGANGVGIRIGNMLKSQFDKVTTQSCGTGLRSQYVTSGFPTTVLFNSCVFTDSTVNGALIVDGWNLIFSNCDFESSAQEGVKILPAAGGVANNIVFQACWFEANYGNNTSQYQFVAGDGTSLGGANINPILRDCHFSTNGSSAKPIRMNGVAVDFVIDNPQIVSAVTGSISVENNAYGNISNWNRSAGMTFDTVVSDANNKAANSDWGSFRSWTPTFTDSVSTGFTALPTLTVSRYKFTGGTVEVTLDWTATLAGAGTPAWIRCTVPTNLTPAANATVLGWLSIGGTWQAGMMAADTSGFIFFRKVDNSNFAAGSAITFRGSLTYAA